MKKYIVALDGQSVPDVEENRPDAADLVATEKGGVEFVENVASLPLIR